ncbi:cysteine desulfurase family protein [Labedella endophytica]|uniref:Cysteine desulfurase n=1 Tax=Labedella endophytica TaxID=1523160 RepID=A0A3S1CPI6_9MICO|nr:cysteine desulfurase family protein [Labedella endophytica]RUQ97555.1 cysteine desulfurase [Labedella endophytica]
MAVYLDHSATTPLRPEAAASWIETASSIGNSSSIHSHGQAARRTLEEAREDIAATLGVDGIEALFVSGGTEAINLAVKGLYWSRNDDADRPVVVVARGEHHATIDAIDWLVAHEGAEAAWVDLLDDGSIDTVHLERVLRENADRTALVTAIIANNEVGTVNPVDRIARLAVDARVPLHLDAVAAYGHVPLDLRALREASGASGAIGPVAFSVSAHKIGGPQGIGVLALHRTATVEPLQHGGGQQRRLRSGTQDVASAAAFATAARLAASEMDPEQERLKRLRDRLVAGVLAQVPDVVLNGPPLAGDRRLASNAHFAFSGCQGDSILFLLDMAGISVSTGSACQAGVPEPSHVLLAMGRSEDAARSALRVTLGRTTTETDVDAFLAAIPGVIVSARRAGLSERDVGAR